MSIIEHREWNIWTNMDFFSEGKTIRGVINFKITPSLMAEQTIGFLYEKLEQIRNGAEQFENEELRSYFDLTLISATNELVIQKAASIKRDTK